MSEEEIVRFLEELKKKPKNDQERFSREIESELSSCLAYIGKKRFHALERVLWEFLNYPNRLIRQEVIRSLNILSPEAYKKISYQIWNDKQRLDLERTYALGGWYRFFKGTKNPMALKKLYEILVDEISPFRLKSEALCGIIDVCDDWSSWKEMLEISKLGDVHKLEDFNSHVDWKRVQLLMHQYAPDLE